SPSGPVVVEIPSIEEGEPTTTIVVSTPTGTEVVEIPVADDNEPSTTIVVDTPTGPAVIEVPIESDTPVVTPAPDNSWMTKDEFKQRLDSYFDEQTKSLELSVAQADAEAAVVAAKINVLDECIAQAADKFGWYGAYEDAPHFTNAVDWVSNVCTVGN
ncbi:hypothetical protein Gpo141_00011505, partial [Globisporangium polare]